MSNKELVGLVSALLSVVTFVPYICSIVKGKTKPHLFTWIVWFLATSIVAAAQYSKNAGPGVWTTIFSCFDCLAVIVLALRWGERHITKSDWITFFGALLAIPLWYATDDPLWSVILI